MTLTLTPKTEAMLLARAKSEGQDANMLADTLLADLLAPDEAKVAEELSATADNAEMSGEMRATAKMLADAARKSESAIEKVLLFPSAKDVQLLYVDPTGRPTSEDETIAPFYFGPNARSGIRHSSAVALILPQEVGKLRLPAGWGTWEDAVEV
jgi:hypothetical protein